MNQRLDFINSVYKIINDVEDNAQLNGKQLKEIVNILLEREKELIQCHERELNLLNLLHNHGY